MKRVNRLVAAIALALGISGAQAATISLEPANQSVAPGGIATFDMVADFGSQLVLGGATDFLFDPSVLTFQNFVFSTTIGAARDPSFDARTTGDTAPFDPWDLQAPNLVTIGFGNFNGLSLPAGTVIGTLTFMAGSVPGTSTNITLSDSGKWGGYFDQATGTTPISVNYPATDATSAQVVPLPAAAWLVLSGVAGLIGMSRRRAA